MSKWAIVEGATGRPCVVPEKMIPEHLTYGRKLHVMLECKGLVDAITKLEIYEKMVPWRNGRAGGS